MRGLSAERPPPSAEMAPEDLLAHPSLWRRLVMIALIGVVAAPVTPWPLLALWIGGYLLVTLGEQAILRKRGFIGVDARGLLVTFALSALHASAAIVLIRLGDPGTRTFAVALIGFSSVNILLRLYSSPRLFTAAMAPHGAVLCWVSWTILDSYLKQGAYLKLLTPFAILVVYAVLLLPTRRRLAGAWGRLVAAKAAAEAASRAKSDFLATISHEIRTPLNGVIGMAQALQKDTLSRPQRERVQAIRQSGETLLSILNDALDFSSIEAGELSIELTEFDMEQVTRGAVATFSPLAAGKGLTFDFRIEASAKGTFVGDAIRVRQILYNLMSNAVKFTEKGGVGVRVWYEDGAVCLEVTDSGIGIAAQRIETLFAPFVQADASATRRHGGAGLGLSISQAIAERMGGRIAVDSVEGRGSVFTVTLPMEWVSSGAREPAPVVARPPKLPAELRVLAAEDNAVNQLVLKTLLAEVGVNPTVVENGAQALEAWRTGTWDVILMDIQMPVMDGVTAARAIRAAEAAEPRRKTPIVAVTANAMSHQLAEYADAGMDLVVSKPLDAASLFDALARALERPARRGNAAAA